MRHRGAAPSPPGIPICASADGKISPPCVACAWRGASRSGGGASPHQGLVHASAPPNFGCISPGSAAGLAGGLQAARGGCTHCLGWVANGISARGLEMVVVAPNLVRVPLDRARGGNGGHPQEQDPSWWTQYHVCWPLSCPSTGDTPWLGLFCHMSCWRGAPCCGHHRPGTSLRFPWGHKLPQRGAAK